MPNTPIISVILPVFNGERYLREAIDSILCQTFENFELIVVNDGSSDSTQEIIEEYARLDSRVVCVSRENRGLVASLNEGISKAQGSWIARMDQDDIAYPQRFERQLEWIYKVNADICGSWVQPFGANQNYIHKHAIGNDAIRCELLFGCAFAHPSVMVKKALIQALKYDPNWEKAEDYELWVRAALSGWKMANVPEVLLSYRQHEFQMSSESSNDQQALSQKVRKKYWDSLAGSIQLNLNEINAVLSLRESPPSKPDMNVVDVVFMRLLTSVSGESRQVILDHLTRLYYRVASLNISVPFRWYSLNKKFGDRRDLKIFISLLLMSLFRINAQGAVFHVLRRLYSAVYFKS